MNYDSNQWKDGIVIVMQQPLLVFHFILMFVLNLKTLKQPNGWYEASSCKKNLS